VIHYSISFCPFFKGAFNCKSRQSLYIPCSVEAIDALGLLNSKISCISVDPGHSWFSFRNDFVLDSGGLSLRVAVCRSIEILSQFCFTGGRSLLILRFESGCKLRRIEFSAFSNCLSLRLIFIPATVELSCTSCSNKDGEEPEAQETWMDLMTVVELLEMF
jgi:hypothetical protein